MSRNWYIYEFDLLNRSDATLVEHMEGEMENSPDLELDDVRFSPNLERILQDDSWVNDATYVLTYFD